MMWHFVLIPKCQQLLASLASGGFPLKSHSGVWPQTLGRLLFYQLFQAVSTIPELGKVRFPFAPSVCVLLEGNMFLAWQGKGCHLLRLQPFQCQRILPVLSEWLAFSCWEFLKVSKVGLSSHVFIFADPSQRLFLGLFVWQNACDDSSFATTLLDCLSNV